MNAVQKNSGIESTETGERYVFDSRGLALVHKHLTQGKKMSVLELGPALRANVSFFCDLQCKVFVEDLHHTVCERLLAPDQFTASLGAAFAEKMSAGGNRKFDLILCWDLLSYLSPEAAEEFLQAAAPHCSPDVVFLVIDPGSASLPSLPARFRIVGEQKIEIEQSLAGQRVQPLRGGLALSRVFPNLRLNSSMRLKKGFVEQVFCAN